MLYLGMRGTSVFNIDCYWLNERVCVKCPLVRAVTDTRHLSMSWMMWGLQLDTWAQDAVWCGPLVPELPALKSLKRIPELWIIITSNTPIFKLIQPSPFAEVSMATMFHILYNGEHVGRKMQAKAGKTYITYQKYGYSKLSSHLLHIVCKNLWMNL